MALDGESTAIAGHVEAPAPDGLPEGHLRLYALDLSNEDQHAGATALGPCTHNTIDGLTTWTCPLDVGDTRIEVPLGTPEGTFTISGALTIDGVQYTDTLEVAIAAVDEVVEVQFDFAPRESGDRRGEPYPSSIDIGETTRLRLGVLNEHGKASAANSIAAILVTTGGEASATYLVIGSGAGVVRATSGDASDARAVFNLGAPPEPETSPNPAALLSSRVVGGIATWLGSGTTTAAELLAALNGVAAISLWRDGGWLSYHRPNGASPAESVDFTVGPGDILRLRR